MKILKDNGTAPSAPSLDVIETPSLTLPDVPDGPIYQQQQQKCWFSLLMNHCLHYIDKNASDVLASEVSYHFNSILISVSRHIDESLSVVSQFEGHF